MLVFAKLSSALIGAQFLDKRKNWRTSQSDTVTCPADKWKFFPYFYPCIYIFNNYRKAILTKTQLIIKFHDVHNFDTCAKPQSFRDSHDIHNIPTFESVHLTHGSYEERDIDD